MSEATEMPDWQAWVGRTETVRERLEPARVAALAATLDMEGDFAAGTPLPPGWHWIFFNPFVRRSALGIDGHPRRGGFLPPITLPRRMWAGGRLAYRYPVTIGAEAMRESVIRKVEAKAGRGGQLVFVTVEHTISVDAISCIHEVQDIVYRAAPTPGAAAPAPAPVPDGASWAETVQPDPVLLFRYSALTSNGHRIHYDRDYAQREERYRDLIVHGPLTATLLQGFATRHAGRAPRDFEFRGVSPLFVDAAFMLEGRPAGDGALDIWAKGPDGGLAMRARAGF